VAIYLDNTMIQSYRECNRKYYIRHQLDLTVDSLKIDLIFGLAWHEALATLWPELQKKTERGIAVKKAFLSFSNCWIREGLPSPMPPENYQPITDRWPIKNPFVALEMLGNYAEQRGVFIVQCTDLEVEKPFAVPLGLEVAGEEVFYIGRLDKIVKHPQHGRLVVEHKTTGWYAKDKGFREDYINSFSPNSQVDGYAFAAHSLYADTNGVWIDAALCHKTVHDKFKFIPIDRSFGLLDAWLQETRAIATRLLTGVNDVNHADDASIYWNFPKNTTSCHMYSGCSFRDLCRYIPSPANIKRTPAGYKVEKWEPFDLLHIKDVLK